MADKIEHPRRDNALCNYARGERNPNWIALPDAELMAAYIAGQSEASIARQFNVSRTAIHTHLKRSGVVFRTQTEANRLLAASTPHEEHLRRIAIAQETTRGRRQSLDHRHKIALTRQARALSISQAETMLTDWLTAKGLVCIPQQTVGPYNVDIGAFPIAVEVFGGTWHWTRNHTERFRYLFDSGWHVIIVFVDGRRSVLTEGAADYVISFAQEAASNPSAERQYRVIWGEGKVYASGGSDANQLSLIVPRRGRHGRGPRH